MTSPKLSLRTSVTTSHVTCAIKRLTVQYARSQTKYSKIMISWMDVSWRPWWERCCERVSMQPDCAADTWTIHQRRHRTLSSCTRRRPTRRRSSCKTPENISHKRQVQPEKKEREISDIHFQIALTSEHVAGFDWVSSSMSSEDSLRIKKRQTGEESRKNLSPLTTMSGGLIKLCVVGRLQFCPHT